jgi:3-dehydroquinate synthase
MGMELTVALGKRSYPVFLDDTREFPDALGEMFGGRAFAIVTNTTLAGLYDDKLTAWEGRLGCGRIVIADGEQYKNLDTWQGVLDSLLDAQLDRTAVIIAFGGGVVGDIAGFAAACFLRGVDCVQVPTTLLAMVDSSIGGKTGVDHPGGKNRIGAFHQPRMVWVDTRYLSTLPDREFRAGYGEVFKYAFIGGSDSFFFIVRNHHRILSREPQYLLEAIERSIRIKAAVVSGDEHEKSGKRALLNFGHTFAHALETYYEYRHVLHGEAVLWGIACAVELGKRAGTIPVSSLRDYETIAALLPHIPLPSRPQARRLYELMRADKKVLSGKIRFVLPAGPGEAVITDDVKIADVTASIEAVTGMTDVSGSAGIDNGKT